MNPPQSKGYASMIGLGTANLEDRTAQAVCNALQNGYSLIDGALLYGNQRQVGEGIRMSGVARDAIQLTSKVGFFPHKSEGVWMHNPNNEKGNELESLDLCLAELGVDYVDLLLLHNPVVSVPEYKCASAPHFFELFTMMGRPDAINQTHMHGGEPLRPLVIDGLQSKLAREKPSDQASLDMRKQSWKLLEEAHRQGKAKRIGVSNYPAELLEEMKSYAEVMPAVNQIEFHPRFSSPETLAKCRELGISVQGYGVITSMTLADARFNSVVGAIADRTKQTPLQTCIRWAIQKGVCPILRSGSPANQRANLAPLQGPELSQTDMEAIDSLEENYPFYWLPEATKNTISQ